MLKNIVFAAITSVGLMLTTIPTASARPNFDVTITLGNGGWQNDWNEGRMSYNCRRILRNYRQARWDGDWEEADYWDRRWSRECAWRYHPRHRWQDPRYRERDRWEDDRDRRWHR